MHSSVSELEVPDRRAWAVLAVVGSVAFMAQLDLFIVNVAIPSMQQSFPGSSLSSMSWVLNAYAIAFATLLVPAGRLADEFGQRRFLLVGIAVFTLASVVCAVAPSIEILVAARALQGAACAAIVPASLGLLYPTFPTSRHGMVVGIWAGIAAVAASAGPIVGGLLVSIDWRLIFGVNLPIGLVALGVGLRTLPDVRATVSTPRPAGLSVLSLLVAIASLVFATAELPDRGWDRIVVGAFALSAIAVAVSVGFTVRHPRPLIEPALLRNRHFSRSSIAMFFFFVAFSAWLLAAIFFLQNVWGYSALRSGLALAPAPVASAVMALNAGRVMRRFGRTLPAVVGPILVAAAGVWWIALAHNEPNYLVGFLPAQILGGIGSGLTQAPLLASAGTLRADRATTGSAILTMSRQVGSAIGVAVLVAVIPMHNAHSASDFHHGWLLVVVSALLAASAQIGNRSTPEPQPTAINTLPTKAQSR